MPIKLVDVGQHQSRKDIIHWSAHSLTRTVRFHSLGASLAGLVQPHRALPPMHVVGFHSPGASLAGFVQPHRALPPTRVVGFHITQSSASLARARHHSGRLRCVHQTCKWCMHVMRACKHPPILRPFAIHSSTITITLTLLMPALFHTVSPCCVCVCVVIQAHKGGRTGREVIIG